MALLLPRVDGSVCCSISPYKLSFNGMKLQQYAIWLTEWEHAQSLKLPDFREPPHGLKVSVLVRRCVRPPPPTQPIRAPFTTTVKFSAEPQPRPETTYTKREVRTELTEKFHAQTSLRAAGSLATHATPCMALVSMEALWPEVRQKPNRPIRTLTM